MWLVQSELCAGTMMPIEPSTRESSSMMMAYSAFPMPAPPYFSGKITPRNPITASLGINSEGNFDTSSHSITCGRISPSANSRTVRRNCCCSSVSANSTWPRRSAGLKISGINTEPALQFISQGFGLATIVSRRLRQGKGEDLVRLFFLRHFGMPARGDDQVLFAARAHLVSHRRSRTRSGQLKFPDFLSGFDVECADRRVDNCSGYEDQAARGDNRSAQAGRTRGNDRLAGSD